MGAKTAQEIRLGDLFVREGPEPVNDNGTLYGIN